MTNRRSFLASLAAMAGVSRVSGQPAADTISFKMSEYGGGVCVDLARTAENARNFKGWEAGRPMEMRVVYTAKSRENLLLHSVELIDRLDQTPSARLI